MNNYLYNVPNYETGGVESIYQLCGAINDQGGNAFIYYGSENSEENFTPKRYKHYNLKYANAPEDIEGNNIIVPEIWIDRLKEIKYANKFIFWLSVDNEKSNFNNFTDNSIIHLFQSYYSLDFLIQKGAYRYLPMFDYVESTTIKLPKQNIICYNPLKGMEITEQIKSLCPDITFVSLHGMSREEINENLAKAKIYIDFGNHPGRDKIPREAILNDCIVIVKPIGSAKYYSDVPIDEMFKIADIKPYIQNYFLNIFYNYDFYIKKYSLYKNIVMKQKNEVYNQAKIFIKL
jgi:hypothetical protein